MAKRTKKRKAPRKLSIGAKIDVTIGLLEAFSGQLEKLVHVVGQLQDKIATIEDPSPSDENLVVLGPFNRYSRSLVAPELCPIDGQLHNWSYPWNGMESPFCTKCKQLPKAANCGAV